MAGAASFSSETFFAGNNLRSVWAYPGSARPHERASRHGGDHGASLHRRGGPRVKRISLAFLGEGWQEAYIDSTALTFPDLETRDIAHTSGKAIRALLRDNFLRGRCAGPKSV